MAPRTSSFLLASAVVGAALVAAFRTQRPAATSVADDRPLAAEPSEPSNEEPQGDDLPPNHPPIGGTDAPRGKLGQETEDSPAIIWKVPPRWSVVPNPNTMRLATYHVPAVAGAADEAEATVSRAGGLTDANVKRWIGQFADAEPAKRSEKTVHGLKVSLVEVSGTFQAGAMGSEAPTPRRGWTLQGAVVETDGGAYFFKLTGPTASVRATRRDFDALVQSISPAQGSSPL